jgi:MFS transporter, PCFT/HCP family, solute carrier family 46 (folate transporter), member 1
MENNNEDDQNILISETKKSRLRDFRLEPALLLLFFGYNLASTIVPNILLREVCLSDGFDAANCAQLSNNNGTEEIEKKIQPKVAEILMTTNLMHSIIPAIMSLFLGPWSDKYGRKKLIFSTSLGFTVTLACFCVVSILSESDIPLNPWIFVLPNIPVILSGGWPTMVLAVLCYTTDLTDETNRSSRLTIIEVIIFLGFILGTTGSSFVLNITSPTKVFIIGGSCCLIATFYILFVVEESVQNIEEASFGKKTRELISPTPVMEMFKTCFKKRSFRERRILWGLIIILMFMIFAMNGVSNVFYLFVREKFKWTLKDATLYDALSNLLGIFGCVIGITFFKKVCKFSDMSLIFVALMSAAADSTIKAFAQNPTTLYISSGLAIFKVLSSPMCRSLISSIIPNNEIGKIYSFTSAFEAISSLIASPLYTYVYSSTFTYFAGAFYLLSTIIYVGNMILAFCVYRMRRTREDLINPYREIENS